MREEIKVLRDKGFSLTNIATMQGLCRQTVKRYLKSFDPAITIPHPSRKVTQAMIEKMKMLRNEGLSYETVGAKLGVVAKTVWKYLKSYKPLPLVLVNAKNNLHDQGTLQYS
jgi:predicted transcriptional regulator